MRERLGAIIWGRDPTWGNAFDYLVIAMILVSLLAFTFETLPTLTPVASEVLGAIDLDVWSRGLMVHSPRRTGGMRYGPSSPWGRHNDGGSPSSDTA